MAAVEQNLAGVAEEAGALAIARAVVGEMNTVPGRLRRMVSDPAGRIATIDIGAVVEQRQFEEYQDAQAAGLKAQLKNTFGI
ncbi:MAG TPA: hypothetical protein VFQ63_01940 [Patescibacteria group bacterium]|nr:hypothetical protein [Patescibacteria group bacterium]